MFGNVQFTKWSREQGQFDCDLEMLQPVGVKKVVMPDVVDTVVEELLHEFAGQIKSIEHAVSSTYRSYKLYSTLIITPCDGLKNDSALKSEVEESARWHLAGALGKPRTPRFTF